MLCATLSEPALTDRETALARNALPFPLEYPAASRERCVTFEVQRTIDFIEMIVRADLNRPVAGICDANQFYQQRVSELISIWPVAEP